MTSALDDNTRRFLAERNRMMRQPDVPAAMAAAVKRGRPFRAADGMSAETIALASLHRARVQWRDATSEEIEQSKAWLRSLDFSVPVRGPFVYPEEKK